MFGIAAFTFSTIVLLGFVLSAALTDVRSRKIYNWTVYPGVVAALVLNAVGSAAETWLGAGTEMKRIVGGIGIVPSCAGLAACGGIMLVCFLFFQIGGGDVKLMAMIGGFLGVFDGIEVLLWTFVLGGACGVVLLIWRVGLWTLSRRVATLVWAALRLRGVAQLRGGLGPEAQTSLFLAPSAAVAVVLVTSGALRMLNVY